MKEVISLILQKAMQNSLNLKLTIQEIEEKIEIPPESLMGDFAFPCFFLSSRAKKNPNEIALKIKNEIKILPKEIFEIKVTGAYLNFFVDKKILALNLIKEILVTKETPLEKNKKYGSNNFKKGKKISVEFPSPNTNKPLHLGHLRNMAIGESVSRILEFSGGKVFRNSLNNDRGVHICKSMIAYEKYGNNKTPESAKKKSDHFVGDYYVLFSEKKIPEEYIQEMLKKWEQGDKKVLALWKKMNKWALDGFKETYKKYGIKLDKEYFESKIYLQGKEIIEQGLKKGIFKKKNDGSIFIDLNNEKLGEKIVLRGDGTSIYITQDLYLAKLKFDELKIDSSIYVVGNEQDYHFDVLVSILKKLGFNFADKIKHLSYGMVVLPEGRMKSREGKVVDADDLIEEVQNLAKKELSSRSKLSEKELESRSLKIALSSIKYFLLKVDIKKDMLFNPEESIKFDGDTGPYIQYSYARANSILKKSKIKNKTGNFKIEILSPAEIELIKKLSQFKEIVLKSCETLNPSLIAHYSYQLAQIFNEFYHSCPVIGSKEEKFRLKLVKFFMQVLKNSIYLLGIDLIEEM